VALPWSCASGSAAPATEAVLPDAPPPPSLPDSQRVVPRTAFLTEYPWAASGGIAGFRQAGSQVVFSLAGGREAQVSFAADNVWRLRWSPAGKLSADHSWAVVRRSLSPVHLLVHEEPDAVVLSTLELEVSFARADFTTTVRRGGAVISRDTAPLASAGSRVVCRKDLAAGDRLYGFGEKTGPLLKNGQSMRMWNTDAYGYGKSDDSLYMSVPFFVNAGRRASWGILFDNSFQTFFNAGKDKADELWFGATGGDMDYWFIASDDLKGVLADYTSLTGRMELPPQWALGYQQSRYSYTSERAALQVAATFREKQIPADVIYFDIDFMEGYKSFTHHPTAFPDPKRMLDTLHAQGFKAITIIDPGIKNEPGYAPFDSGLAAGAFLKTTEGKLSEGRVWPGYCVFPDFTDPAARRWWGQLYAPLVDWGFDAFWNDMNEPAVFDTPNNTLAWNTLHTVDGQPRSAAEIHNVYGQQMSRATLEGLNRLRPGQRNLVLSRAGYAGSQRYAAFWTGDNSANWEHLRLNLTMVLGLGLSGFPMAGADVGGYKGNPSPELFARWMQLGALLPFYRNHTETGAAPHEPWAFGAEAEAVSKAAIELRYSLLPHYYTLAREASQTGSPIVRPLFWEFPGQDPAYLSEDEFMVGPGLLAAPVLAKGAASREVWLPGGAVWHDWYSGASVPGGQTLTVPAPLAALPLFVREGAIVPLRELEQWVGQKPGANLTFRIWAGADGRYTLYEDDGQSNAYRDGKFRETTVVLEDKAGRCRVTVAPAGDTKAYRPGRAYTWLAVTLNAAPAAVRLNGAPLVLTEGYADTAARGAVPAHWNASTGELTVRTDDPDKTWVLEIDRTAN
jgi:alpha-glucosidase